VNLTCNTNREKVILLVLCVFVLCSQDAEQIEARANKCEDFNIITLNDDSFYDITSKVQDNGLLEIGLTILYR
jgi:hypothetical protein